MSIRIKLSLNERVEKNTGVEVDAMSRKDETRKSNYTFSCEIPHSLIITEKEKASRKMT